MVSSVTWQLPSGRLLIGEDEVHVWRASLNQSISHLRSLRQSLSLDEKRAAERFYFSTDRDHYIAARGILRAILGFYVGKPPGQLRFCYGPHGKPFLDRDSGGDFYGFNLSHAGGLALYILSCRREVGIDVERIRADFAGPEVAVSFFSRRELTALQALPASDKTEAFFNGWTRKEAYVKAKGEGLSFPLDQFDVSLALGEPAALLATRGDAGEARRWSLKELYPQAGYVAAICVEGHDWQLKCWQWPDD